MLAQLIINGFVCGCNYSLIAFSFALIYFTTKTFHFAHGAVYASCAYLFFTFFIILRLPLIISIFLSLIFIGIIGVLVDEVLYAPLTKKKGSSLIQMLSSLAMYIVIVNFLAILFGNETKVLRSEIQRIYHIGNLILTQIQSITFIITILIFIGFLLFFKSSKLGIMLRAMRDDPELCIVLGYDPKKIRRLVFFIGSILGGVSSILVALDVGIDPNMGLSAFLNGAVAVIIGGIGIFEGPFLGGFFLGIIQSLVIWQAPARWQDTITFLIFIIFLIFKPAGILGARKRAEEF